MKLQDEMTKGAVFSDDRRYRYVLTRIWDNDLPKAMCIGLNPSKANAEKNDPTITNLMKVLYTLGYGGFYMTNLFGLISSDPEALRSCPDPIMQNDGFLRHYASFADTIVFCWGNFKQARYRVAKMKQMFPEAKCFGKNRNGTPIHPMGLMYNGTLNIPSLQKF